MKAFQGSIKIEGDTIRNKIDGFGFVEINSNNQIYKFEDCYAYPGLVDSHGHIAGLGIKLNSLQLNDCKSEEECVNKALGKEQFRGEWLIGYGWNNEKWINKEFPTKKILDAYFKDIPVCFRRIDGHSLWVNSKAMEISGVNKHTLEPSGGEIIREKDGSPTGIFTDNAMGLISKHIPKYTKEQISKFILDSISELNRNGITEVHDMDLDPELISVYKDLLESNKLNLRIYSYITAQNDDYLNYKIEPFVSDFFNISGIKLYVDGALGSRGAALLEPYSDCPSTNGILTLKESELYHKVIIAIEKDFQVAVHSIGDRANRIALQVYNSILKRYGSYSNSYLRLEHAQIIHPDDYESLIDNRIIFSVQPIHCISDSEMAVKRLGKRCKYAYPWNSLIKKGCHLLGGSDFPIESHNPLSGIDAFVNRIQDIKLKQYYTDERISINDAINAYITNPRKVCFNGLKFGELESGYKGDLVILNKELKSGSEEKIKEIKVVSTFINGKSVFID